MINLPSLVKEKARTIKLVVFDVDGVLTDGTLTYTAEGEETKHFNVKDGVGIKLLAEYGIHTAIISAKSSRPLARRAADLKITHFYPGCADKWTQLCSLLDDTGIHTNEVCYVGDDVIDLKVMMKVGLGIAPSDAFWLVRQYAHFITDAPGGKGVAREVADMILGSQMPLDEAYLKAMLPEFEQLNKHKEKA